MDPGDLFRMTLRTLAAHRVRSALTMVGIVIGIASVVLLTSIGEGVRVYIVRQFTQFGTDLIAVTPGKMETWGVPGFLGGVTRKLTIADARTLGRIPGVRAVMPVIYGMTRVEFCERGRHVYIYGVSHEMPEIFQMQVQSGRFLPAEDFDRGSPVCVLGPTLKRELFGSANALGERVRIGGTSMRVVGVMAAKGTFLGIDIDDTAYVPIAFSFKLFNRDELNEIDLKIMRASDAPRVAEEVRRVLRERREGDEDFTVIEQAEMLDTFGKVLRVITMAVAGIAAISLFVGAIGILTIQWVSVHERTSEIGLALAIGATRGQIVAIFMGEAIGLSLLGGIAGLAAGMGGSALLHVAVPGLPTETPLEIVFLALGVSLAVGIISGVAPAIRASRLDPVDALRTE